MSADDDVRNLINSLRESFLVHSYIYYRLAKSIIPDNLFDARAKHLAALHKRHPEIAETCIYQDYFKDYSPATGMDVPEDNFIISRAEERLKNAYEVSNRKS